MNTAQYAAQVASAYRKHDPYWSDVIALLPMNGSSNSTNFIDLTGRTVSVSGGAKISTAQSLWGGSSGYFDGSNATYLSYAEDTTFDFGSNDFTIEAFVYPISSSSGVIFGKWQNPSNWSYNFYLPSSGGALSLSLAIADGAGNHFPSYGTVALNTWSHVAACRSGSALYLFVDGTGSNVQSMSGALPTMNQQASVGGQIGSGVTANFQGYMQYLRVTNGVARYTSNFMVPNGPFPARSN